MSEITKAILRSAKYKNQDTLESRSNIYIYIYIRTLLFWCIKRSLDILFAIIGCIVLLPLTLVVKLAYILSGDFASIFYSQNRVGKNGRIFKLYKFRSMIPNADEELKKILCNKKYSNEWDKFQKLNNDPRITKVGKLLRKSSLDELPQIFNVLKNDMSLVGPRPLLPGELDEHKGNHAIYESVKPGITGWWAANGRSDVDYHKRLALEYKYVQEQGLWMDLKCILYTIKSVLFGKGAK